MNNQHDLWSEFNSNHSETFSHVLKKLHIMEANVGEGSGEGAAAAGESLFLMTHDLVYAKNMTVVKTHKEVEQVLSRHHWNLNTPAPVNEWVDYVYEPPNTTGDESSRPLARLPARTLITVSPAPDDWKLSFFHGSSDCVQQFAARVNTVAGDEIFLVREMGLGPVQQFAPGLNIVAEGENFHLREATKSVRYQFPG